MSPNFAKNNARKLGLERSSQKKENEPVSPKNAIWTMIAKKTCEQSSQKIAAM